MTTNLTDEAIRTVAWAIAEAWWRRTYRQAAGANPEAGSPREYADQFWQGFAGEARAALAAAAAYAACVEPAAAPASDRFVPMAGGRPGRQALPSLGTLR